MELKQLEKLKNPKGTDWFVEWFLIYNVWSINLFVHLFHHQQEVKRKLNPPFL